MGAPQRIARARAPDAGCELGSGSSLARVRREVLDTLVNCVMPWIHLPDDEATPELARLTKRYRDAGRATPGIMAIMKPRASTLRGVMQMNNQVTFGGSSLGRRTEELIATTVSALNECFY